MQQLKSAAKFTFKNTLKALNLRIGKYHKFTDAIEKGERFDRIHFYRDLILDFSDEEMRQSFLYILEARSQIGQDLFALKQTNFKRGGYFVEFGAADGLHLSNTYLLEKYFSWTGILAEPAKIWHAELKRNRSCYLESDCVWSESGQRLEFFEADNTGLSTIHDFSYRDLHASDRASGKKYLVKTISLIDLLLKFNAPKEIDYLSIDTEGSEFDILKEFDFDAYKFKLITCEHNFTPIREDIYKLLSSNGYVRLFENHSKFDDWYIRN